MLKHIILITALSVVCIFFKNQALVVIHDLSLMHDHLLSGLSLIFSSDIAGNMLKNVTALMLVPLIIGLMVACLFWLVKKSSKPYSIVAIWVVWMIMLVTVLTHAAA